eukprot:2901955-Amphidinium_carterae.1
MFASFTETVTHCGPSDQSLPACIHFGDLDVVRGSTQCVGVFAPSLHSAFLHQPFGAGVALPGSVGFRLRRRA